MSKKRYDQRIHANERDKFIFAYVGTYGCANARQIYKTVFTMQANGKPPTESRCKDRLNQLVKGGFLHTAITDARGKRERIYWIDRKASMLFEKEKRDRMQKGEPPVKEVAHTLNMVDIVNAVSKDHTITGFIHEHELKSLKIRQQLDFIAPSSMQVGDSVVSIEPKGEGAYLEKGSYMVESDGDYWGVKLQQKLISLQAAKIPVLYVCFNEARYNYVASFLSYYPNIALKHIAQL